MRLHVRKRATSVRVGEQPRPTQESLAVEEPLEIRVNGEQFSITMRTPGDDFDLVAGFLVSEGVVASSADLPAMRVVPLRTEAGEPTFNVVNATVDASRLALARARQRGTYVTSACGVCGLASIDAVSMASSWPVSPEGPQVQGEVLAALPNQLRERQRLFELTGGVHAAGLFDVGGELLALREDVGRHNAVDKVVGWALREERLPLASCVLQVSGRASFELVQKARMAGIPVLSAVSAPSSLAVDLAEEAGITLVGFSRGRSFTVYTGLARIRSGRDGTEVATSA